MLRQGRHLAETAAGRTPVSATCEAAAFRYGPRTTSLGLVFAQSSPTAETKRKQCLPLRTPSSSCPMRPWAFFDLSVARRRSENQERPRSGLRPGTAAGTLHPAATVHPGRGAVAGVESGSPLAWTPPVFFAPWLAGPEPAGPPRPTQGWATGRGIVTKTKWPAA